MKKQSFVSCSYSFSFALHINPCSVTWKLVHGLSSNFTELWMRLNHKIITSIEQLFFARALEIKARALIHYSMERRMNQFPSHLIVFVYTLLFQLYILKSAKKSQNIISIEWHFSLVDSTNHIYIFSVNAVVLSPPKMIAIKQWCFFPRAHYIV